MQFVINLRETCLGIDNGLTVGCALEVLTNDRTEVLTYLCTYGNATP